MPVAVHNPAKVRTGLPAVLLVTLLGSLGTGVFWHGLSFIAKHTYDFSQSRNLALYGLMGAVYMVGAFNAGRVVRGIERWMTPRSVLAWSFGLQAVVCVFPVAVRAEWALWMTTVVVTFLSSLIWPIVESYLTAGRHGPAMRTAIGWFNLTWMPATAAPMFAMAPLLEHHGQWAIGGLAGANLIALVAILAFSSRPPDHNADAAGEHVAAGYPYLLQCARVLLPMSYVLSSGLAPILPYRFEQIGVDVSWETPATAVWMLTRVGALIVMWRLPFWHGRWGTLLLGAITMAGGFAIVVLAPNLATMLIGFAAMGIGLGVIYYAALYYAMAVGQAELDAGGTHEGLIGAGYTVGPIAGMAGTALGGGIAVVGVMWSLTAVATIGAVRPYLAFRSRTRAGVHLDRDDPAQEFDQPPGRR